MADARRGLSGVVAGRYRVERLVGEGGMATVYLGHDLRHDSRVAVKVLRPELAAHLGGERFVREIRITAQLQHPNILPVFDSGEADGNSFYVMPFVEGETLAQRLRREGPLPVEDALAITAEVADALAYAHARGFVHRDVKPSNIMLTHGHALLADFGIARAMDAALGDALTETGLSLGTITYMSPEQALGDAIDGRTDIYSLGCVLYEILAGKPPFTGSRQAVLARHSVDPVPSLRSVRDSVPESVEQVIVKAMSKAPADRFQDADELKRILRQEATTAATPVPSAPPSRRSVRARWLAGVGAAAFVAVAGWLLGPGRRSSVLAPDRVMMLPLRVSEGYAGPASTGEDVATLIINALDGAGDLRWLDGLAQLDPEARDGFGVPSLDEAGRMARASGAAHFVTGSVTPVGADRASVSLTLYETLSGEPVRTAAPDPTQASDAWRAGLVAANELLSGLIEGAPDISEVWRDREPGAIASFLRGEAAFRRVREEEALGHYRDALARDPSFALAAIRGAQAAAWGHREGEAATMVRQAMSMPLPPRYADFVRGYAAYLSGDADQAVTALNQTIYLSPEMSEAWMQLGETYTHLLPRAGQPDSLALASFEEARKLDPAASNILPHVIEIRLRHGVTAQAEPLLAQFVAGDPDSVFAAKLDIMSRCVRDGPDAVDWNGLAASEPFPLIDASKSLSAAAAQPACAMAGYRALLATDTSASDVAADGRRWAALIGLQSLLISTGRPMDAAGEVDSFVERWGYGGTLLVFDALVVDTLVPRARAAAQEMRRRDGPYERWGSEYRLWVVGALEATRGDGAEATAIADELARRAAGSEPANEARIMEQSLRAHIALTRGDSTEALQRLGELVPPVRPGGALSWDEFAPLGLERLALARLLLARGEYLEAIRVADVFDSPAPHIYVLFTGASLQLRREAATRIPDRLLVNRYEARLEALGR